MEKGILNKLDKFIVFSSLLAFALPINCNVIWPGMVIASGIYAILPLTIISVAIEGIVFYFLLKTPHLWDALCMSLVGNIASTIVGTIITGVLALPVDYFSAQLLGDLSSRIEIIISIIFMYLGNCFIELLAIKGIYGYSFKQLLIPVFIGNLITYALAAYYLTTMGYEL